ncbi:unnamed protein product [Orchesella dallaii]|uniref:Uncharacterized protein n=1 Tax=Orchesella dallaii TaxID=48710 RepID=A0ABP1QVD5_9HEXA
MVPNSSYRIFSKLIILTYALFASAHQIYLFSEADYKGETRAIEVGNCTNLESSFRNRVSSINTTWYSCVQLYDELNCSGNSIKISIRVPSVSNLGNWHFDKKTQSLGTCHDPCVPSLGHNVTEQSDQSQSTLLTLYEYQNFKGKAYEIPVFDGCTRIPDPHIMRVTFRSMRVSKGRCVLIFTGNKDVFKYSKDCIVQSIESIPNVLEIRDDMPILNDLSYWGLFKEETIKAVSPCQCNYFSPEPPVVDDAKGQLIILFTGTYYRGEHISISLDHENCLDLSVSKFKFWEGAARSIYFNDGSCVALYKTHSCRGLPHRELRTHISDLSEYDLDMSIRSFRTCSSIVKNNLGSSVPFYIVPLVVTTLLIVILIGIVVLVAIIILIRRKNGDQNASLKEKLTEKEVEEFMKGLGLDVDVRKLEYSNEVIDNDGLGQVPESSKLSSDLLAQNQPYNDQLEICRNQLEFGKKHLGKTNKFNLRCSYNCKNLLDHKRPIGSGQYGCVFKVLVLNSLKS